MLREKTIALLDRLGQEAQDLSDERFHLVERIKNIDVRLTQVVGAITEIKALLDEPEEAQANPEGSSPQPPESPTL